MDTPRPYPLEALNRQAPPETGLQVTHVRGVILSVVKSILLEGVDPATLKTFLDKLRPETANLFRREITDYEWAPMASLVEAVLNHPFPNQASLAIVRGQLYADRMMTRNHQWMVKVMTPDLLVRQFPRIFSFYHQGGEMTVEHAAPNRAKLRLKAIGPPSSWFGTLISTWMHRCLELCGGAGVEVDYEPPDLDSDPLSHFYWLSWI